MANPIEAFDDQKDAIRQQVENAIRSYQRLAELDLANVTRENATEMYQRYSQIETDFEAVGGVLDVVRQALERAGEAFTEHLEHVGFSGETSPIVTDIVEDEE